MLTSKDTFSGGEEFTNNLKVLKRAVIVGETTGGGAHLVRGHRITEHFGIAVPFARAINPVTHTDWEGTGVEPDVKVDAPQALEVAIKLATERIKEKRTKESACATAIGWRSDVECLSPRLAANCLGDYNQQPWRGSTAVVVPFSTML